MPPVDGVLTLRPLSPPRARARRWRRAAAVAALLLAGAGGALAMAVPVSAGPPSPAPAPAAAPTSSPTPSPSASASPTAVATPSPDGSSTSTSSSGSHGLIDEALDGLASWITGAAVNATTDLLGALQKDSNSPDLTASWFQSVYWGGGSSGGPGAVVIAAWLALLVVTGSLLSGVIRGDIGGMVRLVALRLPVAILLTAIAVWMVGELLTLTDVASGWVTSGSLNSLQTWTTSLRSSNTGYDFLTVIASLILILATLLGYLELLARSAALYIVVAFIPLIALASLWAGSHSALKRGAETIFVLAISKFVLVFVLSIGAGALSAATTPSGLPDLLTGTIIFLLAGTRALRRLPAAALPRDERRRRSCRRGLALRAAVGASRRRGRPRRGWQRAAVRQRRNQRHERSSRPGGTVRGARHGRWRGGTVRPGRSSGRRRRRRRGRRWLGGERLLAGPAIGRAGGGGAVGPSASDVESRRRASGAGACDARRPPLPGSLPGRPRPGAHPDPSGTVPRRRHG